MDHHYIIGTCEYCLRPEIDGQCSLCFNENNAESFNEAVLFFKSKMHDMINMMKIYSKKSEVSDYLDDINDHMNILNEVKEQYSIAKSKSIIVRDSDYHLKIKRFEENLLGSKSFAEYSKIIGLKSMYNSVPVITPRVLPSDISNCLAPIIANHKQQIKEQKKKFKSKLREFNDTFTITEKDSEDKCKHKRKMKEKEKEINKLDEKILQKTIEYKDLKYKLNEAKLEYERKKMEYEKENENVIFHKNKIRDCDRFIKEDLQILLSENTQDVLIKNVEYLLNQISKIDEKGQCCIAEKLIEYIDANCFSDNIQQNIITFLFHLKDQNQFRNEDLFFKVFSLLARFSPPPTLHSQFQPVTFPAIPDEFPISDDCLSKLLSKYSSNSLFPSSQNCHFSLLVSNPPLSLSMSDSELRLCSFNQSGQPHGVGQVITAGGEMYEGVFKNGEIFGYGRAITTDGQVYQGAFSNNMRNGYGICYYGNGETNEKQEIYEGFWKDGMRHGLGKIRIGNNCAFGNWENDTLLQKISLEI